MRRKFIRLSAACLSAFLVMGLLPAPYAKADSAETESAVAGISVALNNYYASSYSPEAEILAFLSSTVASPRLLSAELPEESEEENIGIVSVNYLLNIRIEPNTSSAKIGTITNGTRVLILDEVESEGGKWYKIESGDVQGYIKAEYVLTGEAAKNYESET